MHIRKRGDKWVAIIEIGRDPATGKRKQKWITGRTRKEVEKKAVELTNQVNKDEYFEATDMTVKDYLIKWQDLHCKPNLTYNTCVAYGKAINNHINPNIGNVSLSKLKPMHIQSMYQKLGDKKETARYIHKILHKAFKQAVLWQMIRSNPLDAVECPKNDKEREYVTWKKGDATKLSESDTEHILFLPCLIAAFTGMRKGEVLGLTWNNVDFENNIIHVKQQLQYIEGKLKLCPTKTHRSNRGILVNPDLMSVLKYFKKKQLADALYFGHEYNDSIPNLVCRWADGRPIQPFYPTHFFKPFARSIGLPEIRFHDLRHSHITMLIAAGVNLKIISDRAGHASVKMTGDRYGHPDTDMQKEAAQVIEFKKNTPKKKVYRIKK
ncbi:MAG: tyrosine-type recombinase/integrase [Candidatus Magnetobacterium sp. LHC-1]